MNEQIEILKMIAAKSEAAGEEAAKAIQAINANSPIIAKRLNYVAGLALGDVLADFTKAERVQVASLLGGESMLEPKSASVQVRLTPAEKTDLQFRADEAGLNLSEYIREKLDLLD